MVPLWFTLSALCFVGAVVLLYVDIDRRRGRSRRRKSWARSHGFDYERESTEILKRWTRGVMSTVGDVAAHNVVLGQIRGEAVYIFDLEEVATVIALHRKVGTNVVVDLRLKGLKEPRESDIWLLGAIGPRMVYSTNLDAARRACDRRMVTFGLVGLGRSGMQRQEAQFEATIRTVLHGNHKVAVLGKGGVGKTSVAACVGSILAELRQQDRIVGIDADTAFGRLSSRIDPRAAGSFWELTTDTNLRSFTDITARLGRNSAGLYVLAGQPASGPRRVLDPAIYREAALRLDHHFAISVIDCGSSMEAAVTQEVLRDVDALIVVSSPWADGASAAANTIEWLSDYGLTGLLRRSIVVLNDSDGHADKRTKSLLAQEFIDHGQPVVEVPFDPHLRPGGVIDMSHEMAPTTRLKILQVAATVTAYFASRPADAHGSPPR